MNGGWGTKHSHSASGLSHRSFPVGNSDHHHLLSVVKPRIAQVGARKQLSHGSWWPWMWPQLIWSWRNAGWDAVRRCHEATSHLPSYLPWKAAMNGSHDPPGSDGAQGLPLHSCHSLQNTVLHSCSLHLAPQHPGSPQFPLQSSIHFCVSVIVFLVHETRLMGSWHRWHTSFQCLW